MAPRKGSNRSRSRPTPYDPDMVENWTLARLKAACRDKGLQFTSNIRRFGLVRLLRDHERANEIESRSESGQDQHSSPALQGARSHNPSSDVTQDGRPHDVDNLTSVLSALSQSVNLLNSKVDNLERRIDSRGISAEFNSTQQPVNTSASASIGILGRETVNPTADGNITSVTDNSFTLSTAYRVFNSGENVYNTPSAAAGSASQLPGSTNAARTAFGYAAHTLPLVETVSPQVRQNIVTGKDINLASLLIPFFKGSGDNSAVEQKPDHRLNRMLSLGEFIQAFGTYKQVMCQTFPHRRVELDMYERDVIDMASRFPGPGFYEYHCQFSMRAAAYLRWNNICVDWSVRDNTLFSNIFTNRQSNVCTYCGSSLHLSTFCPSSPEQNSIHPQVANTIINTGKTSNKTTSNVKMDTHGRPRLFHNNKEICNNFNGDRGCNVAACSKSHVCLTCKNNHSKLECPLEKTGLQHKKK